MIQLKLDKNTAKDIAEVILKFMSLPRGAKAEAMLTTSFAGDWLVTLNEKGEVTIKHQADKSLGKGKEA